MATIPTAILSLRRSNHVLYFIQMVALYVALIIAGRRTFNQVPAKFKAAVKADLEALGLDENGNPVD